MKIAFLLIVHKYPEQVNLFLKQLLQYEKSYVFICVDKKSDIKDEELIDNPRVMITHSSYAIDWGRSSQIYATLDLLGTAHNFDQNFDYYSFHSGQDLAIKPVSDFASFLNKHQGQSFLHTGHEDDDLGRLPYPGTLNDGLERIQLSWPVVSPRLIDKIKNKFFTKVTFKLYKRGYIKGKKLPPMDFIKGSNWFTLHKSAVHYVLEFVKNNKKFNRLFEKSFCADEIFFQTILYNSPLKDTLVRENLRYIDWKTGPERPRVLRSEDLDKIQKSDAYFARKFDKLVDNEIITEICIGLEIKSR